MFLHNDIKCKKAIKNKHEFLSILFILYNYSNNNVHFLNIICKKYVFNEVKVNRTT